MHSKTQSVYRKSPGSQSVQDDGSIDHFLENRSESRSNETERRDEHERETESESKKYSLFGNLEHPLTNQHRISCHRNIIHKQDNISRFRRDSCPTSPHSNTYCRGRESWRIIYSVSNHDKRIVLCLEALDRLNLLTWQETSLKISDPRGPSYRLSTWQVVPGEHYGLLNTEIMQFLDHHRDPGPNLV